MKTSDAAPCKSAIGRQPINNTEQSKQSAKCNAALTIPENITLVRLPPYAPELNPIENVWEYLRGNMATVNI
jgi:transposase